MNNYNIHIDRKNLSSEEIKNLRDFDQLMNVAHTGTSSFLLPLLAASFTLLFSLGLANLLADSSSKSKASALHHQKSEDKNEFLLAVKKDSLRPEIAFEILNYTGKSQNYISKYGSTYSIPEQAFQDKNGIPVSGNAEIKIREFHDPLAIWCAQIPMNYDSAGIIRPFESAGMIEFRAYQNGEELQLIPGKEVAVEMTSFNQESRFNYYHLDDSTKNWSYLGKDSIIQNEMAFTRQPDIYEDPLEAEIRAAEKRMVLLEKNAPKKPANSSNQRYSFDLEVDLKDFPYLAQFNQVKFEVLENQGFSPAIYQESWSDARLTEISPSELYQIELLSSKQKKKFKVIPILSGKDLEKAMTTYQSQLKNWETEKSEAKQDLTKIKKQYADRVQNWEKEQKEAEEKARIEKQALLSQNEVKSAFLKENQLAVKRKFKIRLTGICNIDYPLPIELESINEPAKPKGKKKIAAFMNKLTQGIIIPGTVYLIEKGKNLIYGFKNSELNEFTFNPNEENTIWFETSDGKIAVFRSADFENLEETEEQYHFMVEVSDKKFSSKEALEGFLLGNG